jgi:predicted aspartyl protease
MKARYSKDFSPPAPMVSVVIRVPGELQGMRLDGTIDSGADVCAIPDDVVAELDLAPVRTVRAAGFAGHPQEATLYHCSLDVAGHHAAHVEALATRRRYAIIGRNVLKDLVVRLDGPKQEVALTVPSAPGRKRRATR